MAELTEAAVRGILRRAARIHREAAEARRLRRYHIRQDNGLEFDILARGEQGAALMIARQRGRSRSLDGRVGRGVMVEALGDGRYEAVRRFARGDEVRMGQFTVREVTI